MAKSPLGTPHNCQNGTVCKEKFPPCLLSNLRIILQMKTRWIYAVLVIAMITFSTIAFLPVADAAGIPKRAISSTGTFPWAQISKVGSVLNDILSPNAAYSFNSQRLTSLGTPTVSTDAQRVNMLQFNSLTTGTCLDGSPLEFQTSNSTWICGTDNGLLAAITSINSDTTAAQTIAVESGNLTMTNAGATHTIGFGINPVITGGNAQTITKTITLNAPLIAGGAAIKSSSATPVGYQVTNNALTAGSLGTVELPVKTTASGPTDAEGGNTNGDIVWNSANSTLYCRGTANWIPCSGWHFLNSTKLAAAADRTATVTISSTAPRDVLLIVVRVTGYAANDIAAIRFGTDTAAIDAGANYWHRHLVVASASATFVNCEVASATRIFVANNPAACGTGVQQQRSVIFECTNLATRSKACTITSMTSTGAAATVGIIDIGAGEWVNTASQIGKIELRTNGANNMNIGSGFAVFGRNL